MWGLYLLNNPNNPNLNHSSRLYLIRRSNHSLHSSRNSHCHNNSLLVETDPLPLRQHPMKNHCSKFSNYSHTS